MLMTKWTKEYEKQNQLYLHVVELWTRLENHPRDNVLRSRKIVLHGFIKKLLQERKVGDLCLKKNMTV